MMKCRICNNESGNKPFTATEKHLNLRDTFEYFECNNCGCLQISEIPENITKYYPENYYSFNPVKVSDNALVAFLKKHRVKYVFKGNDIIGFMFWNFSKKPVFYEYFLQAGIDTESKILDIGCGQGKLLVWMKREGFKNLTGIDPYVKSTIDYGNGLCIFKKEIDEVIDTYDFIMLHHSFEHMADPVGQIKKIASILKQDSYILIRIPMADSYGWKKFGTNWLALDAPRHFFLHTKKSMHILAEKAGLKVEKITYDSGGNMFWGSIQYEKGISFIDEKSYNVNRKNSIFTKSELKEFEKHARLLNKENNGDAACFYLKK